jgi:hypothetical protein
LAIAALALAALGAAGQQAYAGRIGGPMVDFGTVPAGRSVFFDIPFAERALATVSVMGNGPGNVELYVYDGDGNVTEGGGMAERRTATVNVYRAGIFRVELRNTGRIGGPAAEFGTVPVGQSVYFTIPFEERAQATVAVMGNGPGNVELYIYDADGNVTEGGGMAERRSATINVYRAGYFRVELRNTGTVPSMVLVGTN